MNTGDDKNAALVPAPASVLAQAGPAALALRGLRDLLAAQQADAWFKKGQELWEQSSYTEAVDCLKRALDFDPDHEVIGFWLGGAYYMGWGVPQDYLQAALWYRKAADQGHAIAQNNLSVMYSKGQGAARDDAAAVYWSLLAAEQGLAVAQRHLGAKYYYGHGVPEDHAEAASWFRKAAEQGDADAQWNLGLAYQKGHGVTQDDVQAAVWYRKAAEQGNAEAQAKLGGIYHLGHGALPRAMCKRLLGTARPPSTVMSTRRPY